jgi:hypothetical protein
LGDETAIYVANLINMAKTVAAKHLPFNMAVGFDDDDFGVDEVRSIRIKACRKCVLRMVFATCMIHMIRFSNHHMSIS